MQIWIRQALTKDMLQVHRLVQELAAFENAPSEVITTPQQYITDGFDEKRFKVIVAEDTTLPPEKSIIGIAFYYWAYSTWRGKYIWLEDLIVTENYRQSGVGSLLFKEIIRTAKYEGAMLLKWQVLDWNTPAIKFYEKINAQHDAEWLTYRINQTDFDSALNN
ncbi:MAG: GNAT family N-acetyltransferase [Bacteroidetes bacterium]|nr:GNAT family N-acetyltransferase [Bacteroidota bacterium]MBP7398654.1 GNAT family N-acetyltransferase [Chitinophagales bacterium]MBK8487667.1 GNAT family N-acetyltransferase [Bacteroidota bacterium]MBK8682591.1 GNAT family N-acetyltransferase [Bacteroidota bacterium]MBP8753644.1 GNAT family N-acetyltransferase [Chitinophagales bacterium]